MDNLQRIGKACSYATMASSSVVIFSIAINTERVWPGAILVWLGTFGISLKNTKNEKDETPPKKRGIRNG